MKNNQQTNIGEFTDFIQIKLYKYSFIDDIEKSKNLF